MQINELTFQGSTLHPIDRNGQPWLKAADIARALGYSRSDKIHEVYTRNADEFTPDMCETLNLRVSQNGGLLTNQTRIFSLRGAHLIGMFARTPLAKAFRVWALDVLDQVSRSAVTNNCTLPLFRSGVTADDLALQPCRMAALSLDAGTRKLMALYDLHFETRNEIKRRHIYANIVRLCDEMGHLAPYQKDLPRKSADFAAAAAQVNSFVSRVSQSSFDLDDDGTPDDSMREI